MHKRSFPKILQALFLCACFFLSQLYKFYSKSCSVIATPAVFTTPIEKYFTEGRWKRTTEHSGCRFCTADWVVNICATFSLCTPLSCFLGFARAPSMFRWARCQGLCMSSSHGCSWKMFRCDCELSLWRNIRRKLELLLLTVLKELVRGGGKELIVYLKVLWNNCGTLTLCCVLGSSWYSALLSFKPLRPLLQALMPTPFEAGGQTQAWVTVGPKSHLLSRALLSRPRSLSAEAGVDHENSNRYNLRRWLQLALNPALCVFSWVRSA